MIRFLFFFLFSCCLQAQELEQNIFDTEGMKNFEGFEIHEIRIIGLKYTKERAARWLLSQHEGDAFSGEVWLKGIHKLYDTTVIFDVDTKIKQVGPQQIDIDLTLTDRWTLLPFGIAQAGGGSNSFGGGIWEANVFGYFAQAGVGYSVFNNVASYDVNVFQEFFRDTNFIWGLDVSNVGAPVELQKHNGDGIGSYTWQRQQEQLLFGRKFEPKIRLFSYFEFYNDSVVTSHQTPEVFVYPDSQYRIRPSIIIGRSELTNFLEQGYEFTFSPTSANFFNPSRSYSTVVTSFKRVFLDRNTNYAIFINSGAMTSAPIPYLFHLGGYDTVRGFSTFRTLGQAYVYTNLEYRPYLMRFPLPVLGQTIIQGVMFQDSGIMKSSSDLSQSRDANSQFTMSSAGVGIRVNVIRFAGFIGRMDVARTINPDEGIGISLGVGQFF